jgi:DNA modification methylase|tara:strand:+ start:69 stop:689 length:621 start_codon:yes stop_codon:yes gene_type:complete
MLNKFYHENCIERLTNKKFKYNYIITSPPDFSEIGLSLKESYYTWIKGYIENFNPINGFVTICITDRRGNGGVITKHKEVIDAFQSIGWEVHSYKIWVKSFNIDLYKLPYQHLITFTQNKRKVPPTKRILEDIFCIKPSGFKNSMPVEICSRHINCFTELGEVVYDPFLGSGTTAIACKLNERRWVGSEINKDIIPIIEERLKNET